MHSINLIILFSVLINVDKTKNLLLRQRVIGWFMSPAFNVVYL